MHTCNEAREDERSHRRPLFGSVWLALFYMLRSGANLPRGAISDARLSRGDSPSRRR